jgi:hypothetical protein
MRRWVPPLTDSNPPPPSLAARDRLSEVIYTVSPMKTGVMGGLFKDFGSVMTKKVVGWTDVGGGGLAFVSPPTDVLLLFFLPSPPPFPPPPSFGETVAAYPTARAFALKLTRGARFVFSQAAAFSSSCVICHFRPSPLTARVTVGAVCDPWTSVSFSSSPPSAPTSTPKTSTRSRSWRTAIKRTGRPWTPAPASPPLLGGEGVVLWKWNAVTELARGLRLL